MSFAFSFTADTTVYAVILIIAELKSTSMKRLITSFFAGICLLGACKTNESATDESNLLAPEDIPFTWDNATIYFLLTDRFHNGNPSNDFDHSSRSDKPAPLRGYMGGDFAGITQKINEGYFNELGVNAIWISPVVEQIEGSVDEGTGTSFGFHGYWTKDWTSLNPYFGNEEELRTLIKTAHEHDIRVLLDVVANHTGPVTPMDPVWPDEWVKTGPKCEYTSAESTINCTLVENLPDIRTENRTEAVEIPKLLLDKWEKEGRKDQELAELEQYFSTTGFPRTPYHYILKWLVDYIEDFGFDGFRVDTAKHTEEYVWSDLWKMAQEAWAKWKKEHPDEAIDDAPFYMVGEVYNYYVGSGRDFDYGDQKVDFFDDGFHSLVNFDFKYDAKRSYDSLFSKYDEVLFNQLKGKSIVNYISSHDDGQPFDQQREMARDAGTKLLLTQGVAQIYYGDETARPLNIEAAQGDAKLRSYMNWDDLLNNDHQASKVLDHWKRIGVFRNAHPAIGAGRHKTLSTQPYVFARTLDIANKGNDAVVVGMNLPTGKKSIETGSFFENGLSVKDYYSGHTVTVENGIVSLDTPYDIVLLGR